MKPIHNTLRDLARPRMTGTDGATQVAAMLRTKLRGFGYEIREYPFTFSTIPGRFGVSLVGWLFLAGTLGAAAMMNMRHPGIALSILLLIAFLSAAIAVLTPVLHNSLPIAKVNASNFMAIKPGSRPRYLVMAHFDSKSQPVPLAFRGPAIAIAIVAWIAFVIYTLLALLDTVWIVPRFTMMFAVLCFISGVVLVFYWVDNRSPGALDNATGLATLLGVAELTAADNGDVGYLLTDAEEFGLVGAREIASKLDPVIGVINIDSIDDEGNFFILEKFGLPARHIAPHLAAALLTAATDLNLPAQRRNVPFGLLVDHIPLAQRNLPAVTLGRVTWASLRRVHRPNDSIDALNGSGVESAIAMIHQALTILREQERAIAR
jgi:hypothetical protein